MYKVCIRFKAVNIHLMSVLSLPRSQADSQVWPRLRDVPITALLARSSVGTQGWCRVSANPADSHSATAPLSLEPNHLRQVPEVRGAPGVKGSGSGYPEPGAHRSTQGVAGSFNCISDRCTGECGP